MRRRILLALLPVLLLLSGCGDRRTAIRDVRDLELISTLGVDKRDGQIVVTASTGTDVGEKPAKVFTAAGESLALAVEHLRRSYTKGEAFFAYTEHVLIGPDAWDVLPAALDLVTRSTDMRLGVNLFLLTEGTAEDLMVNCQCDSTGVSDMLAAVAREAPRFGMGHVFTCGDVLSALAQRGCALVQTVRQAPAEELSEGAPKASVETGGFAVLKDGRVAGIATREETAGMMLLMNLSENQTVALDGVTVELTEATARFDARASGEIAVEVAAAATVVENAAGIAVSDPDSRALLERKIDLLLLGQIKSALSRAESLEADVCDIGRSLAMAHPLGFAGQPAVRDVPGAAYSLRVTAAITRTYDVADPVPLTGQGEKGAGNAKR